ncbi:uncharacterized protein LOC117255593 isoform X2 [Epinephelus lanceolatus]
MTRAALVKLLILVILAFIICLPEFFTLYKVLKVKFLCFPYRPCERGNQVKKGGNDLEDAESRRKDICVPSQTPGSEKWEQACTEELQNNTTDPESDYKRGEADPEKSWFMCETDMDMTEIQSNISSSALKVHLEMSVELQLRDAETLNLTLYSRSNHSSLHLHPPEEGEEEEEKERDDEGQRKAFYCCLPVPPTSESANQSRCLLWLANQTVLTATAKERLLWKRKDGEKHSEIILSKGMIPQAYESRPWSGLSPIQEVDTQDEIETLLDGNVDHCYTAHLHHRCHPATSFTEEQA